MIERISPYAITSKESALESYRPFPFIAAESFNRPDELNHFQLTMSFYRLLRFFFPGFTTVCGRRRRRRRNTASLLP